MIERDTLDALELDGVLRSLADLCATPLGAERLAAIRPLSVEVAVRETALIAEYARVLEDGKDVILAVPGDVRPVLLALAKEGLVLAGPDLALASRLLAAAGAALAFLRTVADAPELSRLARSLPSIPALTSELGRALNDEGVLLDGASPELASIRQRRQRGRGRLDRMAERFFESHPEMGERIVTVREDRTVIAARSDLRPGRFGLVHGRSATGVTLYVEPFELVAANNEAIELRDEEKAEETRILRRLSERLRGALGELESAADLVAELDFVRARGRLKRALGGGVVVHAEDGAIELEEARHPVLVLERGVAQVVPLTVALGPGEALVVTGPNTGGKTVALKTVGLAALSFACGLPVSARRARLPLFASVFVDIGDPQDIAQSLSTFSGHVRRVAHMLERLELPALVLLDELGAGTDPREGAALGVAVADRLRREGATAILTSHHEALKRWALSTPGVRSAAVEFDDQTLRATYRLLIDRTGSSKALLIAERLGLDAEVIAHARRLLVGERSEVQDLIEKLEGEAQKHDDARARADAEAATLTSERAALNRVREDLLRREATLRESEGTLRRRLRGEADVKLRAAVEELRREGAEILAQAGSEAERRRSGEKLDRRLTVAAARLAALAVPEAMTDGGAEADAAMGVVAGVPGIGDRVRVASFGVVGELVSRHGDEAEVAVGGKRLRVATSLLERVSGHGPQGPQVARAPAPRGGEGELAERVGLKPELKLIGLRVEEALEILDKYLDDASLARLPEVRIIHGHGSGRLRTGVRAHLKTSAQVRNFESATDGGSTVVRLED